MVLEDDNFTDARARLSGTDDDSGMLCFQLYLFVTLCHLTNELFV